MGVYYQITAASSFSIFLQNDNNTILSQAGRDYNLVVTIEPTSLSLYCPATL